MGDICGVLKKDEIAALPLHPNPDKPEPNPKFEFQLRPFCIRLQRQGSMVGGGPKRPCIGNANRFLNNN